MTIVNHEPLARTPEAPSKSELTLFGVDGCKGGWVIAEADGGPADVRFRCEPTLRGLFEQVAAGGCLAVIDIPIGLPDRGERGCDVIARRLLSPKQKSSVFPAPIRAALQAVDDYARACALVRERDGGRALSRQAHALLSKIKEVDDLMSRKLQNSVREGHPEVTFAVLAGRGLRHPKKTLAGRQERLKLLQRHGLSVDPGGVRRDLRPNTVAVDDIIDAAACLLAAQRLGRRQAFGAFDRKGLRMEIAF